MTFCCSRSLCTAFSNILNNSMILHQNAFYLVDSKNNKTGLRVQTYQSCCLGRNLTDSQTSSNYFWNRQTPNKLTANLQLNNRESNVSCFATCQHWQVCMSFDSSTGNVEYCFSISRDIFLGRNKQLLINTRPTAFICSLNHSCFIVSKELQISSNQ